MDRSIIDGELNQIDVALPTANGTSYSADIDLGSGDYKAGNYDLLVTVPDLTPTHLPNADTLTVNVVAGATASPTTKILSTIAVYTGASNSGAPGSTTQVRLPSNVAQYVRIQFVAAGGTGDMSAVAAEVGLRF